MSQILQNIQKRRPVLKVLEDLGHAGALRGIARFTRQDQSGPTEPHACHNAPKRAERVPVLNVLKDQGRAETLRGIARFT